MDATLTPIYTSAHFATASIKRIKQTNFDAEIITQPKERWTVHISRATFTRGKSELKTPFDFNTTNYFRSTKTGIYIALLRDYLIQDDKFEAIVEYITREKIDINLIKTYCFAARKYMSIDNIRLDLLENENDTQLYITLLSSAAPAELVSAFDTYMDNFLLARDPDDDKIQVSIDVSEI